MKTISGPLPGGTEERHGYMTELHRVHNWYEFLVTTSVRAEKRTQDFVLSRFDLGRFVVTSLSNS
jgi:hypothetical protein